MLQEATPIIQLYTQGQTQGTSVTARGEHFLWGKHFLHGTPTWLHRSGSLWRLAFQLLLHGAHC